MIIATNDNSHIDYLRSVLNNNNIELEQVISVDSLITGEITEKDADILFLDMDMRGNDNEKMTKLIENIVVSVSIPVLFNDASDDELRNPDRNSDDKWDTVIAKIERMAKT